MIRKLVGTCKCVLLVLLTPSALVAERAIITIDPSRPGPAVSPTHYGIFLEEINHGVDGGLYGEMVRNRGFEDSRPPEGYTFQGGRWRDAQGFDSGFSRFGYTTNGIPFWSLVQEKGARGSAHLETSGGVSPESAYCLRLDVDEVGEGRIGIANEGYFGIGLTRGGSYLLSLYARSGSGSNGPLAVRLEDRGGDACSETKYIKIPGRNWNKLEIKLTASRTTTKARLVVTAEDRGTVWLDMVSLFPEKTWKGRPNGLRPDIAEMIAGLKPGFVRFPGGCVVEGGTVETAYDWKVTIGPVEKRQERWGPWNYRRTQGMGLFEYLQFCEDLNAEPLWVGFCGQTCIFRRREQVPMDEMGWVRDGFVDLIEYANGASDSKWGSKRAAAGHADPFDLKLVEIGNENQGEEYGERYRFVHDALKAKHPELTYFADLSWTSRESLGAAKWDIEDRHYYNSSRWFASRFHEYDTRDRTLPPLYLGEVAVTSQEAGPTRGNLRAALAEGVFLMGCEQNSESVRMVSYAPLLAHVEGRTELTGSPPPWHAMIYFDGTRVFGTVSYYLWKLFSENRPDQILHTEIAFPDAKPMVIAGQIGLGTWDATAEFKDVRVERNGQVVYTSDFATEAKDWTSSGGRWSVEGGSYRQTRRGLGYTYTGEETWTDYELTLKARKSAGGEGFLIIFGRKGNDRYWWNLGGWGNSQHAIEFNQTIVGQAVRGRVENDRWYDIRVRIDGRRIRCYLDGELIHDVLAPETEKFFSISGRDAKTGEIVLKAINYDNVPMTATIKSPGLETGRQLVVTVLQSNSPDDNNSLEEPEKVKPVRGRIEMTNAELEHVFPANSFTVMRFQAQ